MNSIRYFLPHILALSTNSPFWLGMETGYKGYRAKVFENFPAPHPRLLLQLLRVRELRQPPHQDQLHRQRQKNLVGHSPASLLQHRRSPHLRHPPPRSTRPSPSPRSSRPPPASSTGSTPRNQDFRQYAAPLLDGEQVPRRPLRPRRQTDRLRQTERSPRTRPHPSNTSPSSTTSSTSSAAATRSTTFTTCSNTGTGADRQLKVFRETGDLKKVVDYMAAETKAGLDLSLLTKSRTREDADVSRSLSCHREVAKNLSYYRREFETMTGEPSSQAHLRIAGMRVDNEVFVRRHRIHASRRVIYLTV